MKEFKETLTKHFPNLMNKINLQIQAAQQNPSKINSKKYAMHITVKLLKDKENPGSSRILLHMKEAAHHIQRSFIGVTADASFENMETRRQWG